ncbi:hypothetical protein NW754_005143 [Fusarium falciforme]|nr:hypothetical protein NW754_005143 [Fusarium falciforme]
MSSITADSNLTLFLWLEGFFPKQIVYFLLLKGLANSPSQLYEGKTNDPRLSIKVLRFNGSAVVDVDPSDLKPASKSSPCLRITDPTGKNEPRWIHETPRPLERALMNDIHSTILQSITDSNYYIKNAAAVTTSWSGIRDEDRSLALARHAKENHVRALLKAQEWAAESLEKGGWLTPGLDHPGLVDAALAGGARYMELSYSLDVFEDERLGLLKEWYARFKQVSWWPELEESGRHPKELSYPSSCRDV